MVLPTYILRKWANRHQNPNKDQRITERTCGNGSTSSADSGNMGKSNKFDFTNRSSLGDKLGKSIGQSLGKEAAKILKDAAKQAGKAGSRHSTGSSENDGSSGSDYKEHCIDLQAPNKELGDAGFVFVIEGLKKALGSTNGQVQVVLEDLNLSGNKLTTASLALLAPIIELACHNLKTLNLSNNAIVVVTDLQAKEWETFLASFKHCYKLRRLDLSSNTLGMRAFEIFARVHAREAPVDPRSVTGEASVLSLNSIASTTSDQSLTSAVHDASDDTHPLAMGQFLRRRQGLRSIPYITFQHVDLDDESALWLSYVVEDHYYPVQLIDSLNAPTPMSSIKAYQQDANQNGIDYTDNDDLGNNGSSVLEIAEAVRRRTAVQDHNMMASTTSLDFFAGDLGRVVLDRTMSRAVSGGGRRISIRSVSTTDEVDEEMLESARKKIQRNILEQHGVLAVELWGASFSIFMSTRMLAWMVPKKRKYTPHGPLYFDPTVSEITVAEIESTARRVYSSNGYPRTPYHSRQSSYAATLLASPTGHNGETELAVTDTTNSSTSPPRMIFKAQRKGGFSEDADVLKTVTDGLVGAVLREDYTQLIINFQRRRLVADAARGKIYRDKANVHHFPSDVMDRILREAAGDRQWSMLSDKQRGLAMDWAFDKKTLTAEAGWAKHAASIQVWTLLEKVQGLEYVAE